MKIIFSNFDDLKNPYYGGGGAMAVHAVAKRLAKDHEITVLTGKYPGSQDELADGVNYRRIGSKHFGPRVGQAIFQLVLPIYVMTEKFDVWVESFTPPFSTACLQLFTKKPVIGLIHSLSGKDMRRRYKLPFDKLEKLGLKTYKYIIALTEYTKDIIATANRKARISIIPNGIDGIYIDQTITEKKPYILFLGRIDIEQKGLDLLLEAYKRISDKIDLKLIIAGGGIKRDENELRDIVHKLGLESKVEFAGRVGGDKKTQLLNQSQAVIVPSRAENFALIALEAFCAESVLIVFDIPGFSWIPSNISVKVKAYDTEALASGIYNIATDKASREEKIIRAKEFVKQYDWDKVADQYQQLIMSCYEQSKQ